MGLFILLPLSLLFFKVLVQELLPASEVVSLGGGNRRVPGEALHHASGLRHAL